MLYRTNQTSEVLEKAKSTPYKHKEWFINSGKTVYEAISYFVDSGEFYLDTPVKYLSEIEGYQGTSDRREVVKYLIEQKMWKNLVIRYGGRESGTDKGKLKILTFIELTNAKL